MAQLPVAKPLTTRRIVGTTRRQPEGLPSPSFIYPIRPNSRASWSLVM